MKKVNQKIMNFVNGDCYRACICSILEKELEDIPNFQKDGNEKFAENLDKWISDSGFRLLEIVNSDSDYLKKAIKDCYVIASGTSPRDKNKLHAVVWYNGEVVHDPHPDNTGLIGEPNTLTVFLLPNPAVINNSKE